MKKQDDTYDNVVLPGPGRLYRTLRNCSTTKLDDSTGPCYDTGMMFVLLHKSDFERGWIARVLSDGHLFKVCGSWLDNACERIA